MTTSTNQTDTTPSGHAEDQFWDLIQRAVTSQVPAEVTERSVNSIRDTLAVGVAGTREAVARASADSLCPTSGLEREAATVWASGERDAAWANAIAMHCLDWDDYMHPMHGHCTSVLAAVYLALGEETGASGDQLLRAYIAGYDVNGALGAVLSTEHYAQDFLGFKVRCYGGNLLTKCARSTHIRGCRRRNSRLVGSGLPKQFRARPLSRVHADHWR